MSAQDEESDWSDSSAGSVASSFSTTVMLGLPDGPVETPSELLDAQVSRLGGPPSFLYTLRSFPDVATTHCRSCGNPSELLVQLYAPLEGSVDDRVVYVFGCARAGCQGEVGGSKKGRCVFTSPSQVFCSPLYSFFIPCHHAPIIHGSCLANRPSLRAFSSIRRNDKFASAHERRAAKKAAKALANRAAQTAASTEAFNPFAVRRLLFSLLLTRRSSDRSLLLFDSRPHRRPRQHPSTLSQSLLHPHPPHQPTLSPQPTRSPPPRRHRPRRARSMSSPMRRRRWILARRGRVTARQTTRRKDLSLCPILVRFLYSCSHCPCAIEADTSDLAPAHLSAWSTLPSYPAQYLSTQTEFLSRPKLSKKQKAEQDAHLATVEGMNEDARRKALEDFDQEYVKGSGLPGADETFERFVARLQDEPSQVVRCTPLSFCSTSKENPESHLA